MSIYDRIWAFDIDGCIQDFATPFSNYIKQNLKISYSDDSITEYYWHKCIDGLSREDFEREFHKFGISGGYRNLPEINGANAAVAKLISNAIDFRFITSRPYYLYSDTYAYLNKQFGVSKNKIIFAEKKFNDILGIEANVVVEDSPYHVLDIVKNTPALVYLMDATYNKDIKHDRIKRVYGWQDILELEGL